MRPVCLFANAPSREIEQVRDAVRGRWRQAARAVMVLLSLHGLSPAQIAGLLDCHPATVRRWISRFNAEGLAHPAGLGLLFPVPADVALILVVPRLSSPWTWLGWACGWLLVGIVLAATFAALVLEPTVYLTEVGAAVAIGVVLDTLLVRTVPVSAALLTIGERVWWPTRPGSQAASVSPGRDSVKV